MVSSVFLDNILTGPVIAFVAAFIAAMLRFDFRIPEALYSILSFFLLLAIGIKGGKALAGATLGEMIKPLLATVVIGVVTPLIAYALFKRLGRLDVTNAAALAAHYGSVSAVTFAVLVITLESHDLAFENFAVGILAILEIVGIVVALLVAHRSTSDSSWKAGLFEVVRGRSIAILIGGLLIGSIVGAERLAPTDPLFVGLFSGALTLFLIELGAVAATRVKDVKEAGIKVVFLSVLIPLINGLVGAIAGSAAGMSTGGVAVMATLAASASYIAAPAAVRIALPDASPGIYVTASIGITFPFNLLIGIPIYIRLAEALT